MRGGVTDAGQTTDDDKQLKIELLSQWKLEAESRNNDFPEKAIKYITCDISNELAKLRRCAL